jgi:hypothetical protein
MSETSKIASAEKAEALNQENITDSLVPTQNPLTDNDAFELVYDGPNVADGTMSARELAEVLKGLTRAFSTVAHERDLGDQYELRIRDIESNSFHVFFEAFALAKSNPGTAAALATGTAVAWSVVKDTTSGAYKVVTDIAKAIDARRKLKGARLNTTQTSFADGDVILSLSDGAIVLTKEQYELLLSRRLDKSISQIISPLKLDRIDNFQIKRANQELVEVKAIERDYFDYQEATEHNIRDGTEITGTLNSLTKSSRRGTFYTSEGVHVPYKYVGGDDAQLLRGFSAREPLRVRGRIKFDSEGVPSSIEVEDIEALQRGLLDQ